MRRLLLSTMALGVLSAAASAAEPQKAWEASGFKQPESAVYDQATGAIYVSNVNGDPMQKDGNGFISKVGTDGKVAAIEWVKGLNSPTGLTLVGGTLYAADVDQIVAIDIAQGKVTNRHTAEGAKFLNDLTADKQGRVYASDMPTDTIWVLEGDKIAVLLKDEELNNPNGLLALDDGRILVGSWGRMAEDFSTKVPGHMRVIDVASKKVSDLGDPTPVGNLDGIEPDGSGGYLVTDWMNGVLFRVAADGKATKLLSMSKGAADLGVVPEQSLALIPMMMDGTLVAYSVK
jgi:sugar lactone lactonase YvrE